MIGLIGELSLGIENLIFPITIAGISGSLYDSTLGNYVQGKYLCNKCNNIIEERSHCNDPTSLISGSRWIDNNMVNFLNTLVGAVVAYIIWI